MTNKLDGKALGKKIKAELKQKVQSLQIQIGRPPGLAVLMSEITQPVQCMSATKKKLVRK